VPGDFHFALVEGKPRFLDGPAKDPDFELTLAPAAVTAIAARPDADVGEWNPLLQHIVAATRRARSASSCTAAS